MNALGSRILRTAKLLEYVQDELNILKNEAAPDVDERVEHYDLHWSTLLGTLHKAHEEIYALYRKVDDTHEQSLAARHGHYTDDELCYAATARCHCGAGLAYHKQTSTSGQWECSDILTERALPASHPEAKEHTPPLPFAFYEVKSEQQPSANGVTTRPAK